MCKKINGIYINKTSFKEMKMIAINSSDLSQDVLDALKSIANNDIEENTNGLIFLVERLKYALDKNSNCYEENTLFKLKDIFNNVKYYNYINLCKF